MKTLLFCGNMSNFTELCGMIRDKKNKMMNEVFDMATTSIIKDFVIEGQEQVEKFADAIEASANDKTPRVPVNVIRLQGLDNILKFMERRSPT